jgi:hypothetical protein
MKPFLALLVVVHGVIHLMGPVKAFGLAELPQLTLPIPKSLALLWLLAALLLFATATALYVRPRWWWVAGLVAVAISQAAIITSWNDAKYGTIANGILFVGVVFGFLLQGPFSLRAEFDRAVDSELRRAADTPVITDADLAHLPVLVQNYLRTAGAVGQPRVKNFRARFRGQIRSGPHARWMSFKAEQLNSFDDSSRLFFMEASMFGIPFQALHLYLGPSATMRVKVASLLQVADAKGPDMDRSETVTLLNDMCVLAPGALITRRIRWDKVDSRAVRAFFTNAGHTISAELSFSESGELTNFLSDDRLQSSSDGRTFTRTRWSTPVADYRAFGPHRISAHGEARWHTEDGAFAYGRFELYQIEYNVSTEQAKGKSTRSSL